MDEFFKSSSTHKNKMRKFYKEDLQHDYQHDSHFRNRVEHSEAAYAALLKRAAEEPQNQGVRQSMLERFIGDDQHCTYFFYGCLQPPPSREKDLLLYMVRNFQPQPGVPFTFVYFNHHTPSSDYYFRFKNIFDLLPLRVIEMMRTFYLVKPYFYIKAFDMLGQSNRIFAATYQSIDTCVELVKRENYKVHDFVTFVPEEISEEFPSHLKRRPSLLTYRINVEGQNLDEEQLKEKSEFQNSVRALITKQVYKLENYELGEMGIPMVLQLLVGYFKEKPTALLHEGIFRKSVSIDEENETLEELSSRNFGYLQQITNPHLIASLIKKFFSNLKEPIIPFPLFDRLMHDQGIANKREFIKQQLSTLPPLNFISLMFVIEFLRKDVVPVEHQTKMSAHNLAICFSPAFMRSEKPSFADIANASKAVIVTEIMINDFDEVFGHQQQRNKLFQKSMMNRRIDFKRNLKEELDINIDDRTSEEVSGSFIIEGSKNQQQPIGSHPLMQQGQEPPKIKQTQQHPPLVQTQQPPMQSKHPHTVSTPSPVPQVQQHIAQPQFLQNPPLTSSNHDHSEHAYRASQQHPIWGNLVTKQYVTLSKEVYKANEARQSYQQSKTEEIQIKPEAPSTLHQTHSESFLLQQHQEQEQYRPKSKKTRQQLVQLIMKNKQEEASEPQPSNLSHPQPHIDEKPAVTRSTINFGQASDRN